MKKPVYNKNFYDERGDSTKSAKEIVPHILSLTKAQSVVDIGCGNGAFLKVFSDLGVKNYLGIDGDWVKKEYLLIPKTKFKNMNLEFSFEINNTYDLAISLEVAEHISEESSHKFIESITKLAPIVVFSAAIPLQGGTYHINEQWPQYWVDRFAKHDFVPIDCLRPLYWNNKNISYWYSQNMILYIHKDHLSKYPNIKKLYKKNEEILSLVHPKHYIGKAKVWKFIWDLIPSFLQTFAKNTFNNKKEE